MRNTIRVRSATIAVLATLTVLAPAAPALAAPPDNDDVAGATVVSGVPYSDTVDTTGATTADSDKYCFEWETGNVWYRFTPSEDMSVGVRATGDTYAGLQVYAGDPADNSPFACAEGWERRRLHLTAGETYYFLLGAIYGYDPGPITFSVETLPPAPELDFAAPRGRLDKATGDAILSGGGTCSDGSYGYVSGEVTQRKGRLIARGSFGAEFTCIDGRLEWEGRASSGSVAFMSGSATVTLWGYLCNDWWECGDDDWSGEVRLRAR